MKNVIKITGILILVIMASACTTPPILPDYSNLDPNEPCPPGVVNFKREILPIISSNCAFSGCHDAVTAADDLVLDNYENIMKEVTPFNIDESELYEVIVDTDVDKVMPPPPYDLLTNIQKELIKDWINQGALDVECGGCDTTTVTFSGDVYPIMKSQCIVCHNDDRQDGGMNLASYDLIRARSQNGKIMGTIEHKDGYSPMPPSGVKIDQCFIDKLNKWIADGMLNN